MNNRLTEQRLFLSKFLQSPRNIGSVLPSSRFLVQRMLQPVNWQQIETLVELGAGTGVLTRELERRVRPDCQVAIFERDPELRSHLAQQFPRFRHYAKAEELNIARQSWAPNQVDCILSSLPFTNFPPDQRSRILEEIFRSLKIGGTFVTYQYSLQLKRELSQYFRLRHLYFVPLNIPCAFVYVCQK